MVLLTSYLKVPKTFCSLLAQVHTRTLLINTEQSVDQYTNTVLCHKKLANVKLPSSLLTVVLRAHKNLSRIKYCGY